VILSLAGIFSKYLRNYEKISNIMKNILEHFKNKNIVMQGFGKLILKLFESLDTRLRKCKF
jgi:hypothetical protein